MVNSIQHGGDFSIAEQRYGYPEKGWLDLSTGINPTGYPVPALDPEIWQRLPQTADEDMLTESARRYYCVPETATIISAPGTQSILQWLPQLRPQSHVQVVSPTYAEHAHCWRQAGHNVTEISEIHEADADVVVVVNPNNPDGRIYGPDTLMTCAETQSTRMGWLIVDEAFMDVDQKRSLVPMVGMPGLIVLRSLGKFFGLAGLRVGFAIGHSSDVDMIKTALGPWSVPGPAIRVASSAITDTGWQREMLAQLAEDTERLDRLLLSANLKIVGGTSLYRLTQSPNAGQLFEHLARAGILVRPFDINPTWLRFGLPGTDEGWERLEEALGTLF